ncbi:MAG: PepSY domain-containing protein [Bauldia sp.]
MTMAFREMRRFVVLAAIVAALAPSPGRSGELVVQEKHDQARNLLEHGEIRPLEEILASLAVTRPGEVVAIDLENEDGRWVYEVKVVTASGSRIEVNIDAATGKLIDRGAD